MPANRRRSPTYEHRCTGVRHNPGIPKRTLRVSLHEFPDVEPQRETVEVAAGVLRDDAGRVLVSRRPAGRHLAGLWEFPGGKVEADETPADALARELNEELGVRIGASRPLVAVRHEYREKIVHLRLFEIHSFEGTPDGREGQPLKWASIEELASLDMPAADRPLVRLLDLDPHYSISPSPGTFESDAHFIDAWRQCLEAGFRLIRLRPIPGERVDGEVVGAIDRMTREYGGRWIASGDLEQCYGWPAHGIHLNTAQLMHLDRRPWPSDGLLIASCHDLEETRIAESLEADLVTLSPVAETPSHPEAAPLGWDAFERVVRFSPLPVLALGGVRPDDWQRVRAGGGFGVAGIRAFGWR
jgi:8-oxo-dGTP diphosphatase